MALKSKSLAVIIPVRNEEKIIEKTVGKVIKELKDLPIQSSLVIVNDGSIDNTKIIIKKSIKRNPNILNIININKNKGYGYAIQAGIEYCIKRKIDYALFMDSDLTNDPADIKKFANEINQNYDCIKASRYIKGGKIRGVPVEKILISRLGNLIASTLFNVGVKDCTNGFRMIRIDKFRKIRLRERGFPVIMEEIYYLKKRKAKFKEISVTLKNRKTGMSHFKYSFKTFYSYLKYPVKSLWL